MASATVALSQVLLLSRSREDNEAILHELVECRRVMDVPGVDGLVNQGTR